MLGQRRIQDSVPTMQTRSAWTTIRLDFPLLSLSSASSAAASQLIPCARLRWSTALAARSVDRHFTVDSLSEVARGRSAPAMQGPNEKAARLLDIYVSVWFPSYVALAHTRLSIGCRRRVGSAGHRELARSEPVVLRANFSPQDESEVSD